MFNQERNRNGDDKKSVTGTATRSSNLFKLPFPFRLWQLLDDAERNDPIISWLSSGESFGIFRPKEFASDVLPQHFPNTSYTSFVHEVGYLKK